MRIGIIVAMDKEFVQLKSLLTDQRAACYNGRDFVEGRMGEHDIVMQQCGIGKVNSAVGAVEMIHAYHPDLIISSGCAGGADTSLEVGDVVVASACAYHDAYCGSGVAYGQIIGMPARFTADPSLVDKALRMDCDTHVVSGLTVSGEWFVDSREKMRSILEHFPEAMAVDMESTSIAQTCHIYGVPFVSFRIISDVPLKDRKASQYFDFWSRMAEGSFDVTRHFLLSI